MENPFFEFPTFTNPYYEAPRPRYYYYPTPRSGAVFSPGTTRSVPVQNPSQLSTPPSQRKVVSVPVRFVGTEESRAAAAVKIQKVLRGFIVRRAVRKVLSVAAEVAEVERRMARKETVEMVRREEKERLRLNEMLMGLLFRLDSIRGIDSGVRDCRKRVIRRLIALQERLDAIASGGMVEEKEVDGADFNLKDTIADGDMVQEGEEDRTDSGFCSVGEERVDAIADGNMVEEEEVGRTDSVNCSRRGEEDTTSCLSDQPCADEKQGVAVEDDAVNDTVSADLIDNAADSAPLDQKNGTEEIAPVDASSENAIPAIEKNSTEEGNVEPGEGCQNFIKDDMVDENKCSNDFKGVMERMVDENVKLQRLVADLCEKNVLQSRLINSLSQRVEQLEKVMARRKKKRQAPGTVEDLRKCGKKL